MAVPTVESGSSRWVVGSTRSSRRAIQTSHCVFLRAKGDHVQAAFVGACRHGRLRDGWCRLRRTTHGIVGCGHGLWYAVQLDRRLYERHERLVQQPELDREVVDPGRGAQHRRIRRLGHHRRLYRRYDHPAADHQLHLPELGGRHVVRGRGDRAVLERAVLQGQPRQPGLRPDDQHLVLGPVHLHRRRRHHPAADRWGWLDERLCGDRGAVQPDVPEPERVLPTPVWSTR
jgi:hypothetical protein